MGGEIPGVLSLPPTDAGLLRARPRKLAHACPLSVHQIRVRILSFISAVIFVCVSLPAFISWLWPFWDITEFYHYRRSWLSLWPTAGILRHRVRLRTSRPDSELSDTTLAAGHEPWWEPVLMENSKRRFRGEPALRPRAAQRRRVPHVSLRHHPSGHHAQIFTMDPWLLLRRAPLPPLIPCDSIINFFLPVCSTSPPFSLLLLLLFFFNMPSFSEIIFLHRARIIPAGSTGHTSSLHFTLRGKGLFQFQLNKTP